MRGNRPLRAAFGVALALLAGCGRSGPGLPAAAAETAPVAVAATESSPPAAFVPLPDPPGGPRARARVTPLPNGAALVTGGLGANGASNQVLLFDPLRARFVALPPLREARYGHEATLLPGKAGVEVLVTGGFDGSRLLASVELVQLDPSGLASRARTVALPPLPTARSDHRALLVPLGSGEPAVLLVGGFVPVPGGEPLATGSALLYRPRRGEDGLIHGAVSVVAAQPRVARFDHSVVLLPGPDGVPGTDDDRVLVWGGCGFDPSRLDGATAVAAATGDWLVPLASGEVYEPALDRWSSVHLAPESFAGRAAGPRRGHRAARTASGAALILGGAEGGAGTPGLAETLLVELDARDAGLARVSPGASLATPRRDAETGELEDGRILLAGGKDPATGRALADLEVFSPSGTSVEAPVALGAGRVQHGLAVLGSRVLVVGGFCDPQVYAPPTAGLVLLRRP